MAGTWEALRHGQADLAIGVGCGRDRAGVQTREIGTMEFVFASRRTIRWPPRRPISDAELLRHRAVAVADSAQRLRPTPSTCCPARTC
jgi:DNA-binding transcriptional LysR family regulator